MTKSRSKAGEDGGGGNAPPLSASEEEMAVTTLHEIAGMVISGGVRGVFFCIDGGDEEETVIGTIGKVNPLNVISKLLQGRYVKMGS